MPEHDQSVKEKKRNHLVCVRVGRMSPRGMSKFTALCIHWLKKNLGLNCLSVVPWGRRKEQIPEGFQVVRTRRRRS